MATVTCHTEGCANADIPLEATLTYIDPQGITHQIQNVICGVCNRPIHDIKR